MLVKILEIKTQQQIEAFIREGKLKEMPSIHENWRFNFNKQLKKPFRTAYVLVKADTPDMIEGCLIFEMIKGQIPYIAYIEIAPHNRRPEKRYDFVEGCLIAYAFKQSLIKAKGDYKGLLFLEVSEDTQANQQKLMAMYNTKYNAKIYAGGTMLISDEGGEELIKKYLESDNI